MSFVRVVPNERLAYELTFADFGMKSEGELFLVPAGKGTRVPWTSRGHVGPTPEFPQGLYHYHIVSAPPYIAGCFRGQPGTAS